MKKLSIRDLGLGGKRVFIRVDFNVPLDGSKVADDTRIRETLPTLRLAMDRGARLVLASHLGRPKGKPDPKYSLMPVANCLKELLGKPVEFSSDCVGPAAVSKSEALRDGEVLLLENVRFHPEEEANDPGFSKQLAGLCDEIFVCDAFGSAHRAHASVVGITKFVRQAAAGLLMEKELAYLGKAISNPERPFVAVLGGAKVSDKIEVVQNLMKLADAMLIGGAMAYTFLKSQGLPVGKSLVENDKLDLAHDLLDEARKTKFRLLLPVDHVLAESPDSAANQDFRHREYPRGLDGSRHRPQNDRAFQPGDRQSENDRLERPARHVRKARIRSRHACHRPSRRCRHQSWRHIHRRRWRLCLRRRAIGSSRPDFAHLDGRRRFAGISRG